MLSRVINKIRRVFTSKEPSVDLNSELIKEIGKILMGQKLNVIDVGGAVSLQPHFNKLIGNANFYVFEPDERSYYDLVNSVGRYSHPNDFKYINKALSGKDGKRTLYLTNVPTGSSLLEVDTESPFVPKNSSYFFPVKEISLDTVTINTILTELQISFFDIIKLDVQGAEMEIIQGIDSARLSELNAIELEVGLHSVYKHQTTFTEVESFMKANGFGLFDLRTSRSHLTDPKENKPYLETYFQLNQPSPSVAARLYEFDAIYFREPHWIRNNPVSKNRIMRIVALYCVYNFYAEAIQVTNDAKESGKFSSEEHTIIIKAIIDWNKIEQRATQNFDEQLSKNNYLNWGQYMWVKYPSN